MLSTAESDLVRFLAHHDFKDVLKAATPDDLLSAFLHFDVSLGITKNCNCHLQTYEVADLYSNDEQRDRAKALVKFFDRQFSMSESPFLVLFSFYRFHSQSKWLYRLSEKQFEKMVSQFLILDNPDYRDGFRPYFTLYRHPVTKFCLASCLQHIETSPPTGYTLLVPGESWPLKKLKNQESVMTFLLSRNFTTMRGFHDMPYYSDAVRLLTPDQLVVLNAYLYKTPHQLAEYDLLNWLVVFEELATKLKLIDFKPQLEKRIAAFYPDAEFRKAKKLLNRLFSRFLDLQFAPAMWHAVRRELQRSEQLRRNDSSQRDYIEFPINGADSDGYEFSTMNACDPPAE